MRLMSVAVASIAAAMIVPAASAAMIQAGTVSSAYLFNPTVNVATDPSTYAIMNGGTFQVSASGGFAQAQGGTGTLNGNIQFSKSTGVTLQQTLTNLFVFADGRGGTYNFSANSVLTRTFIDNPGVSTSGSIYLLGTTLNSNLGFDPTATSLTISFNSTGGSPFSSSATLSAPPASAVPEPAAWAMMVAGFGVIGAAQRRRKRVTVRFA